MLTRMFTRAGWNTRKGRKGNAMVEAALVSLVFFLLVLGIFDFGQFLFVHQALVHRARTAIRAGAIYSDSSTAIKNRILYNQSTAKLDSDGNAKAGYFGLTANDIVVYQLDSGTDSARVNVQITSFPFVMLSGYAVPGPKRGKAITVTVPLGMFN